MGYNLHILHLYVGYNPFTKFIDPNFQRDIQVYGNAILQTEISPIYFGTFIFEYNYTHFLDCNKTMVSISKKYPLLTPPKGKSSMNKNWVGSKDLLVSFLGSAFIVKRAEVKLTLWTLYPGALFVPFYLWVAQFPQTSW